MSGLKIDMKLFRLYRENITSPLLPGLIKIGKRAKGMGLISARYGMRIISSILKPLKDIDSDDFVEIVDYDPIKNNLLFIGNAEPHPYVSVHWIILGARKDKNVILHLFKDSVSEYIDALKEAKDILSYIKDDKSLFDNNNYTIILGRDINDLTDRLKGMINDS